MASDKDNEPLVTALESEDNAREPAPVPPTVSFLDDETEEETEVASGNEVSYDRLYAYLLENEDIIITIDEEDVEDLRKGLSTAKYVYNNARKRANAPIDTRQIDFKVVERLGGPDAVTPVQVQLQVWLKARKSVHLHRLVISSKGL